MKQNWEEIFEKKFVLHSGRIVQLYEPMSENMAVSGREIKNFIRQLLKDQKEEMAERIKELDILNYQEELLIKKVLDILLN